MLHDIEHPEITQIRRTGEPFRRFPSSEDWEDVNAYVDMFFDEDREDFDDE